MRQFDLFDNPSSRQRESAPFVVVLSSHFLGGLAEVIVAPVVRRELLKPNAVDIPVRFDGEVFVVSVIGMAALRRTDLKRRRGSIVDFEFEIRRALDRLFTGF
ncbi:MAG: CcdB family protein [Brevundimonas sp.]